MQYGRNAMHPKKKYFWWWESKYPILIVLPPFDTYLPLLVPAERINLSPPERDAI